MHPELIKIGSITIRWYGFFVALGFLAAFFVFKPRAERLKLDEKETSNLMMLLLISGIIGARLYYVIWRWRLEFSYRPSEVFMIHHGGLVFFGGFFLATLGLIVWSFLKHQPLAALVDALAPALAIGHALGRLGCFMNGCCYGKECHYPWAIRPEAPPEVAFHTIHPTQLYEFFGLLNIFFALLVIEKAARYQGQVGLSYFILYSILRFVVEFFRGDVPHEILGHFTSAQVVSVIVFVIGWLLSSRLAYLTTIRQKRIRKQAQAGTI
jgi:phosphatidylglycerol---prolipoprotein diacylglyceryl transferase